MLWSVWAVLLVVGVAAVVVGRRGRRVDDHPLCRRCGFDLTGKPETSTRCGECGADLAEPHAVRVGHTVRRRGPLWAGVLLLIVALIGTGTQTAVTAGKIDWRKHAPAWYLVRETASTDSPTRDAALAELIQRVKDGKLDRGSADALVVRGLAHQADAAQGWVRAWGDLIEAARYAKLVSDADWGTYALQSVQLRINPRVRVVAGDPLPIGISQSTPPRLGGARFSLYFSWETPQVAGGDVRVLGDYARAQPYHGKVDAGSGSSYWTPAVEAKDTAAWPAGERVPLTATFRIDAYDYTNQGDLSTRPTTPVLASKQQPVSAQFDVLPRGTKVEWTAVDPKLRQRVRDSVTVDMQPPRSRRYAMVHTRDCPANLLMRASWRRIADGKEFPDEYSDVRGHPQGSMGFGMNLPAALKPGDRVELVLRPNIDAAKRSIDTSPIWGEEIVIGDLIVPTPATQPESPPGE
jgi:hypothetical protein